MTWLYTLRGIKSAKRASGFSGTLHLKHCSHMKTPLSGLLFSPNQSLQKYKWQQSFYSSWCSLILVYCCCKAWENVFPHLIFYMCLKIHTGNVKCSDVWKGERKTCFWYFSFSLGKFFEVSFQFAWLWEENQAFNKWKHRICKVFGTKKNSRYPDYNINGVFFYLIFLVLLLLMWMP